MKGGVAKNIIFGKLMETFPDAFMYNGDKEMRINLTEEGVPVQIKVTLTAAKTPVEPEGPNAFTAPGGNAAAGEYNWNDSAMPEPAIAEPTEEEKQNVAKLVKSLGF